MIEEDLIIKNINKMEPKIHSITNTITINDCANILLAAGGHATMASDPAEAAEMTSHCDGLVLNLGAVSSLEAMLAAGKESNRLGHPVVLDPVAAGATSLRENACRRLLSELRFSAIRGNASEIRTLSDLLTKSGNTTKSFVDTPEAEIMQEKNLEICRENARCLSQYTDALIVVSGKEDLVVYQDQCEMLQGGSPLSARITGSGCMLTELICLCMAATPEDHWSAACTAVRQMNLAAEKAARKTQAAKGGTMSFRMYLIDEISRQFTGGVPGL